MTPDEITARLRPLAEKAAEKCATSLSLAEDREHILSTFAQPIADWLDEARLEEAVFIRDEHLDQGGWELVDKQKFDAHITELERAAGK